MKLETKILNDFFELLNKNMINYCVMNNYIDMPEIIPSDVDFAISFEDYQKALALAPESGYVFISLTGYYEKTNQMEEAEKCLFKIFEAKHFF